MTTRWPCAVVVSLMACSAPPLPEGACAGVVCTQAQRCEPSTLRCVRNALPKVVLIAPTTVVRDASFELRGTVTDDTKGTTLEWRDGLDEWQPVEVDDEGAFVIAVPTRALDAEPMVLTLRADDGSHQVERSALVIVDRVGPKFELESPSTNEVIGTSIVVFTVVARDGSEGLQDLFIGERSIEAPRTGTEVSVPLSIPEGDRRSLPVIVSAKDLNGNRSVQLFMLQVDRTGPMIRFRSPTTSINTPSFRLEVEVTDPSAVDQVRLAMDDGGFIEATFHEGGVWSADFPMPLEERQVVFTAAAVDGAGNANVLSLSAGVDRAAPTLELVSPAADSVHNRAFTVSALASVDAVSVTAQFDGATVALTRSLAGAWEGQVPLSSQRDRAAAPLVVVARDAAGNQRAASFPLFIDTVAPTVNFTNPRVNARLNASNFVGTDEVTVAWRVEDGDALAATVSVDAVPSTSNTARVATLPADDGRAITRTVVVADRAGNVGTGTLTFTVDRRAPTVVTWSPAANARNVEPRKTTLTFSEHVMGPTSATDALNLPGVTQPGAWDAAHTTWTSPELPPYAVIDATLNGLTDDAGNPAVVSSRRFHTAAFVPASGLVLGTNVTGFQATADSDGVVTIATMGPVGFRLFGISPVSGAALPPVLADPHFATFSLNASLTVEPTTLVATHRVGSTRSGGMGLVRHLIVDGVATAVGSTTGAQGSVVSQLAFEGERDTTPYGVVDGTTYRRGITRRTLSAPTELLVAQSASSWAGFSVASDAVSVARFLCIPPRLASDPTVCTNFHFQLSAVANATELSAAISPSGGCLVVTAASNGARLGTFIPLARCNETRLLGAPPHGSCVDNTYSTVAMPSTFVAPFDGNGEDTVLAATEVAGVPRLHKLSDSAACTGFGPPIGAPAPEVARAWQPVQLGNKPALLYTDANHTLKLHVP